MTASPKNITELKENEIFVFGSNLSGIHGAGAAKLAYNKFGAVWGQGTGLTGQSYALPTVSNGIKETLPISEIKHYVQKRFIPFAQRNPDLIFLITEIGCGLAGYKPSDIAPLFKDAINIENIHLPQSFINILNEQK